jgi:molecular chaperone DnaJ
VVEASLGTDVTIPALDGELELSLSPGTQPGEVKVFRGRGVPQLQRRGRGDLKVVVNVIVPRHLSAEQRGLLERFDELTADRNYEPDGGFFDKVRSVFRQ